MKMKIKLYLDFDNTIVNTNEVAIDYFNKKFGTSKDIRKLKKYNFKDLFESLTDKEIQKFFSSDYLYKNITFLESCYDKLYSIRNYIDAHVVTICCNENIGYKTDWISENMPIVSKTTCVVKGNNDKSSIDMSDGIFIDDHIECLRSSNAKIKILYKYWQDTEWNEYDNLDEVYVVNSWDEITEILKFYIENGEVL